MGVRIYCDHCGNTVTSVKFFYYGEEPFTAMIAPAPFLPPGMLGNQAAQNQMIANQYHAMQQSQQVPSLIQCERKRVELCNACAPIWMKRVEALTKASDG